MNEPCACAGPGYCPRFQREILGREYEICSGQCPSERPCPPPAEQAAHRRRWQLDADRCRHQGPLLGTVACPSCGGHVEVKVFACAPHTACTLRKPVAGLACCATCADYQKE